MTSHEKEIQDFGKDDDFWLFGYGSLIWKPPPHYDQRVPGYIEGYVRRFWQASEDHRGTPSSPGRVVTLIDRSHWTTLTDSHAPTERVWGAAYHIPSSRVAEVREYLDIREINGYSIQFTPFFPAAFTRTEIRSDADTQDVNDSAGVAEDVKGIRISRSISAQQDSARATIKCLVYIGLPSNPQFLGPQDPQELARHILRSRGPSGENREYLFLLEKGLRGLSAESGDGHVSDLVGRCLGIEREGGRVGLEGDGDGDGSGRGFGELHKVGSTEEQEEVEK